MSEDLKYLDEYDYLLPLFRESRSKAWDKLAEHILKKFDNSFNECVEAAKKGDEEIAREKKDELINLFDDQLRIVAWLMVNDYHNKVMNAIVETLQENKGYEKLFYRLVGRLIIAVEGNYEKETHISEREQEVISKVHICTELSMEDLGTIFGRSKASIHKVLTD